ncbi:hypothetical protein E8E15_001253 [Penicillium rubens]|nr:hypothetical protein E8E15_001253 [Penicillium rubens]
MKPQARCSAAEQLFLGALLRHRTLARISIDSGLAGLCVNKCASQDGLCVNKCASQDGLCVIKCASQDGLCVNKCASQDRSASTIFLAGGVLRNQGLQASVTTAVAATSPAM